MSGGAQRRAPRARIDVAMIAVAALAVVLAVLPVAPASAGSAIGAFEIDGNLADDSGAGDPVDWHTPPERVASLTDPYGGGDDIFANGSKELAPGTWTCTVGSVPQKSDIREGAFTLRTVDGDQFANLNWRRLGTSGDVHLDYELNRSAEPNPSCSGVPRRSDGDLIIAFDTEEGGKHIVVRAFQWQGDATSGTFVELPTGSFGTTYDAAVNIPNTIPGYSAGEFGEATLNITDTIGTILCGEFAKVYVKSRASTSINAELKDRTLPQDVDLGPCPSSTLDKTVRNVNDDTAFSTTVDAAPGDTLEYRIVYRNTGNAPAPNVAVHDTVPAWSTFLDCTASCTTDGTSTGSAITWSLGTVEAGGSRTMTFRTQLDDPLPTGVHPVTNVATTTNDKEIDRSSNETVVDAIALPASELHKSARNVTRDGVASSLVGAEAGDVIEYAIAYHNHGTADATAATIVEEVPARSTFLECTNACTAAGTTPGSAITWELGTVPQNGGVDVAFRVRLDATFDANLIDVDNVARATTAEEPDGVDSNLARVRIAADPVFDVEKGVSATEATAGDTLSYTITVTNTGTGPGSTTVVDGYDARVQVDATSITPLGLHDPLARTITWTTSTLQPGQSETFSFDAALDATFSGAREEDGPCAGSFVVANSAGVNGDEDTVQTCVTADPAFDVVKSVSPASAALGDRVTYTLLVTNVGQGPGATPVTDTYDARVTVDPATIGAGVHDAEARTITWAGSTLEPGATQIFTFAADVTGPFADDRANEGACSGTFAVPNRADVEGDTSTATLCVSAEPLTSLHKTVQNLTAGGSGASSTTARPGDTLAYTIAYANEGEALATGVVVRDAIPARTTFAACAPVAWCSHADGVVSWTLPPMAAGAEATLTLQVLLDATFPAGITLVPNVAAATADRGEPVTSSEAIATITVLSGISCPTARAIPGGAVEYRIPYGVHTDGRSLDEVVLSHQLPAGFRFGGATPQPTSAPDVGAGGIVVWELGTVADGSTGVAVVHGTLDDAFDGDAAATSVVAMQAQGVPAASFEHSLLVTLGASTHDERAYGLEVRAPVAYGPEPDSDRDGDAALADVADPSGDLARGVVLQVQESGATTSEGSKSTALVTMADVRAIDLLPGEGRQWLVSVDEVRAVASSDADLGAALSSHAGSVLKGVTVGERFFATVTQPTVLTVALPGGGEATVRLLETEAHGDGAGTAMPEGALAESTLAVNAVHVTVVGPLGDMLADVVVGGAQSSASFEVGLRCGASVPKVAGTATAASFSADDEVSGPPSGPPASASFGSIALPPDGGTHDSWLTRAAPIDVEGHTVMAWTGAANHAEGTRDNEANASSALTSSHVTALQLLDTDPDPSARSFLLTADAVYAEARSNATGAPSTPQTAATGETTIAGLRIAGQDVCGLLGLEATCEPEPNTALSYPGLVVILNEQIAHTDGSSAGITVNALRVIVLAGDETSGLPAGSEIVIGSVQSTSRADEPTAATASTSASAPQPGTNDAPHTPHTPHTPPTRAVPEAPPAEPATTVRRLLDIAV